MRQFLSKKKQASRAQHRANHIFRLEELGWTQEGSKWRCPRGRKILYTTEDAIGLEQIRGGIRLPGRIWKIK